MALAYQFTRLREAGLRSLPLPSVTGRDDGLLFYQVNSAHIDTLAVWSEEYAVALRGPSTRDWANPFQPSDAIHRHVGSFEDVVNSLLALYPPRRSGLGPSLAVDKPMGEDWRLVE